VLAPLIVISYGFHSVRKPPQRGEISLPRRRRPIESYQPGELATVNIRLPVEDRAMLDRRIQITGTNLRDESSYLIRWALNHQEQLGGPGVAQFLVALAGIANFLSPGGKWLVDPEEFPVVRDALVEMIDARTPLQKITIEEQVAAGRGLISQVVATTDPRRRTHLQELLGAMAQNSEFPEGVRREFVEGAKFEPAPWADRPPTPPVPADWVATPLDHLNSAWQIARATLLGQIGSEPDDMAIAGYLVDDAWLRHHGGVPPSVSTAEELLEFRDELTAVPALVGQGKIDEEDLGHTVKIDAIEKRRLSARPPKRVEMPVEAANEAAKSDAVEADDPLQFRLWRAFSLLASLDAERFPRRTQAILTLLQLLSKDPSLPSEVRDEFAALARGEAK
jgi:hypothetical protein